MIETCGYAISDGGRMYYQRWCPANAGKVPIVLVHESLGSVAAWRDFPLALARSCGREVIAYDRLGYGRSDSCSQLPGHDFIQQEAQLHLPALLAACGVERFVAFGHSVGGEMAVCMGAALARRCAAVIAVSAQAFIEACTLAGVRAARERLREAGAFARLQRLHADKACWVLDAWTETWLSPAFRHWNMDAQLRALRCPLLVIHGSDDIYSSPEQPLRMQRLAAQSQLLLLENCGHVPWREHRETVLVHVAKFLRHLHCS